MSSTSSSFISEVTKAIQEAEGMQYELLSLGELSLVGCSLSATGNLNGIRTNLNVWYDKTYLMLEHYLGKEHKIVTDFNESKNVGIYFSSAAEITDQRLTRHLEVLKAARDGASHISELRPDKRLIKSRIINILQAIIIGILIGFIFKDEITNWVSRIALVITSSGAVWSFLNFGLNLFSKFIPVSASKK